MEIVNRIFSWYSKTSRLKRRKIFRENFTIDRNTKILDLGSEDGSNIAMVLNGTDYAPENVFIADIEINAVKKGLGKYGFTPVLLTENEPLPFENGFFDIVYSSSVLEHVTVSKSEIWELRSGREFRSRALRSQKQFADEIKRVGKQYFVQTPCRSFPLESHSWLPGVGVLPREIVVPIFRITNRMWVKKTIPDFFLLSSSELQSLFPDASVVPEQSFGITKSLMAIRTSGVHD